MIGSRAAAKPEVLETLHLAHRHVDGPVDCAGLDGGYPRRRVFDDFDRDARDLCLWSPIIVVALKHNAGIQLVFDKLIRSGSARLFEEIFEPSGLDVFFGNHEAAEECQPLRGGRGRRSKFHRRLGRRFDDDLLHFAPGIRGVEFEARFGALEEGVAKILRRHFIAVVEGHVVAQLDGHAQGVRGQAPVFDQMWNEFELRILVERLIENRLEDRLRIRCEALIGIP